MWGLGLQLKTWGLGFEDMGSRVRKYRELGFEYVGSRVRKYGGQDFQVWRPGFENSELCLKIQCTGSDINI